MADEWLKSASRTITAARIDITAPNPARVWDSMNGGRDNFDTDRRVARYVVAAAPALEQSGVVAWAFRARVERHMVEAGVRQFADISLGMRGTYRMHAVVQAVAPACHVVYVANDPVVLSHARATLRSSTEGAISYVDADPCDIEAVIPGLEQTLDLGEPVGLLMPDSLHFTENASGVVARLVSAISSGSYVAVIQAAPDPRMVLAARRWTQRLGMPVYLRERDEVARWFGDLDLLEPGVVEIHRWRPEPGDPELELPYGMPLLGAVARKR